MKKDYLKYIFGLAIACISFMIIDDVYALSTYYPLDSTNAVNEIWYVKDYADTSEPFGTHSFDFSNFHWSYVQSSNILSLLGTNLSSKVIVTIPGNILNKYDSFSFTQAFRYSSSINAIYWFTINNSDAKGFIPCEIMSQNNNENQVSDQAVSYTCRYDKNQIQDSDTVRVGLTSFFAYSEKSSDGVSPPPSANPVVFTMSYMTLFTDGDRSVVDSINKQTDAINNQTASIDAIKDADLDDSHKELPDTSKFDEYESAEGELLDKVGEADTSGLSIGIDVNSSNFVWTTLTNLIQSHAVVFGMFISILSIGVIKLALGR